MTAELVPYDGPNTPVVQQQDHMQSKAVERLGAWAQSAVAAHGVAESLVQTSFVPAAFRGKPHEATAAILSGAEVGLSPMSSLRSFDVIQGTAAARAITLRAIVQSQGHEVWVKESTATRAIVCGKRRGSNVTETSTWTMDRAKNLGLVSKDNWKKQPQAMLVARATSEVCRLVAADAILGIGYTVEELSDGADPGVSPGSEPVDEAPRTRRMSRKKTTGPPGIATTDTQAANIAEVPLDAANESVPELITDAQSKKLHATFNELGITDRDQRMAYTIDVIGRDIESSNDLTKDEASRVIDRLQRDLEQPFPEGGDSDGADGTTTGPSGA